MTQSQNPGRTVLTLKVLAHASAGTARLVAMIDRSGVLTQGELDELHEALDRLRSKTLRLSAHCDALGWESYDRQAFIMEVLVDG